MKRVLQLGVGLATMLSVTAPRAAAQGPAVLVPMVVDTAAPIIINAIKPQPKATGLVKFEGSYLSGNNAQITLRAAGNDQAIQTFPLTADSSAKMQAIIDRGGYQYGDRITVYYNPQNLQVVKFKGKPSPSL